MERRSFLGSLLVAISGALGCGKLAELAERAEPIVLEFRGKQRTEVNLEKSLADTDLVRKLYEMLRANACQRTAMKAAEINR